MKIDIYPPFRQGVGELGPGTVKEQKPIGFTGEGSALPRSGTLFYWAWMQAEGRGTIDMHPHQAFEIVTYLLKGKGRHVDSLGNDCVLESGGVQVMQAGSGLFHEEHTLGGGLEGFQIWLEPDLLKTRKKSPVYKDFSAEIFTNSSTDPAYELKRIAGPDSPVDFLDVDASIHELRFKKAGRYVHSLESGRSLNILAVRGLASLESKVQNARIDHKDFAVVSAERDGQLTIQGPAGALLLLIETPRDPGYKLYPKQT